MSVARYNGECPNCDGAIRADHDDIMRDKRGRWVHIDCDRPMLGLEQPGEVKPPQVICRRCNIVTPCWCDEPDVAPADDLPAQIVARARYAAHRDPWEGF